MFPTGLLVRSFREKASFVCIFKNHPPKVSPRRSLSFLSRVGILE
jgi:hypothetical protein